MMYICDLAHLGILKTQNNMKTNFFRKAGLLVAAPTTGKTTLLSILNKQGVKNVVDTDVLTERHIPEFFRDKWYRKMHSPEGRFVAKCRDFIISANILLGTKNNSLVISNLWSPEFLTHTLGPDVKPALYVGRPNASRISELAAERGTPLSLGLTTKWVASSETYGPRIFENVLWLPDDLFLADVVTVVGDTWVLTDIGKVLVHKTADEVRRMGRWNGGPGSVKVKGGSNV